VTGWIAVGGDGDGVARWLLSEPEPPDVEPPDVEPPDVCDGLASTTAWSLVPE
jgi:hypothetical protein